MEFAGRWTLLRNPGGASDGFGDETAASQVGSPASPAAIQLFARTLLQRYGIVFRRLLEREAFSVSWYELGRVYRRWEARGEIRGGHFVSGVSGEQFVLPEAIGRVRSLRKAPPADELIVMSGADPLNLLGILVPGARIPATSANRILLRNGEWVAALEGGQIRRLSGASDLDAVVMERALKVGTLPRALRPYYA